MFVSLFVLSWSFTHQYRQNKENSVGVLSTAVYFCSVSLLVAARILCFEMFAYYLGPGNFALALLAAGAHALAMSALHFVFSDSLAQCGRAPGQPLGRWLRQVLLVAHNCLLNGLANLYVHNNLEIFVQKTVAEEKEQHPATGESSSELGLSGAGDEQETPSNGKSNHDHQRQPNHRPPQQLSYVASDVRQRTLIRQSLFDLIFFLENAAMVWLARDTATVTPNYPDIYRAMAALVAASYAAGMVLKVFFYLVCHPWAELIRYAPEDAVYFISFAGASIIFVILLLLGAADAFAFTFSHAGAGASVAVAVVVVVVDFPSCQCIFCCCCCCCCCRFCFSCCCCCICRSATVNLDFAAAPFLVLAVSAATRPVKSAICIGSFYVLCTQKPRGFPGVYLGSFLELMASRADIHPKKRGKNRAKEKTP